MINTKFGGIDFEEILGTKEKMRSINLEIMDSW